MANSDTPAKDPIAAVDAAKKAVAEVNTKRDEALKAVNDLTVALEKAEADLVAARDAVSRTIA